MELTWMEALWLVLRDMAMGMLLSFLGFGIVWLISLVGVVLGVGIVLRILRRRRILDEPNGRSLHQIPTPRGGGLGVMAGISPVLIGLVYSVVRSGSPAANLVVTIVVILYGLSLISFIDDRRSLSPLLRLFVHCLCSFWLVAAFPLDLNFTAGWLPLWLERLVLVLALVWFINLYNFMDGIDGITAIETLSIGIGGYLSVLVPALLLVVLPHYYGEGFLTPFAFLRSNLVFQLIAVFGMMLAAAGMGFLFYNWAPAKIFLGDSGSIPLGFLSGVVLILLVFKGLWQAALLVPLYYWLDASLTLIHRLRRGERIWQAHRSHFYQRAVQAGLGHAQVARRILWVNLGLIFLAGASPLVPYGLALVAGFGLVGLRLWGFDRTSLPSERFLRASP
ncbi:MAG: glycosyltransferase family 4 protein [Alphaproteobacteria bacterium]|nr:glycosyltransferase family 4 protein [Alphaproteobacteria bacterium]